MLLRRQIGLPVQSKVLGATIPSYNRGLIRRRACTVAGEALDRSHDSPALGCTSLPQETLEES